MHLFAYDVMDEWLKGWMGTILPIVFSYACAVISRVLGEGALERGYHAIRGCAGDAMPHSRKSSRAACLL